MLNGLRCFGRNRQAGVDFLRRWHRVEGLIQVVGILVVILLARIMSFTAVTLSLKVGQWRKGKFYPVQPAYSCDCSESN